MQYPYREAAEMPEEEVTAEQSTSFWTTGRKLFAIIGAAAVVAHAGALVAAWSSITADKVGGVMIIDALVFGLIGVACVFISNED